MLSAGSEFGRSEFGHLLHAAEKRPVVIDLGAHTCKCGFAGEGSPRCVLRTPRGLALALAGRRFPRALVEAFVARAVRRVLFEELLVKPKEHRVVVCEHWDLPQDVRDAVARVFHDTFGCVSVCTGPSAAFALHGAGDGRASGFVVDVGHAETRLMPVVHGRALHPPYAVATPEAPRTRRMLVQHACAAIGACNAVDDNDDAGLAAATAAPVASMREAFCVAEDLATRALSLPAAAAPSADGVAAAAALPGAAGSSTSLRYRCGGADIEIHGPSSAGGGQRYLPRDAFDYAYGDTQGAAPATTDIAEAFARCLDDCGGGCGAETTVVLAGGMASGHGFGARLQEELRVAMQTRHGRTRSVGIADPDPGDGKGTQDDEKGKADAAAAPAGAAASGDGGGGGSGGISVCRTPFAPGMLPWVGASIVGSVLRLQGPAGGGGALTSIVTQP